MKINKWTMALAAAGVVSLGSAAQAEEAAETVMTAVSGTTISGYVSTSAIWNFGTGTAVPAGRAFNGTGKQDGFNLDVVDLTISKPLDEGEWSSGYAAELWFGPDAAGYNASPGTGVDEVGIKQAYVALRAPVGNGLDIKAGVFDSIIGYETANSPDNPNWSRSLAWNLEPTQHTGVLLSYQVSELFGFSAGVANSGLAGINTRPNTGAGTTDGGESRKSYMAAFSLTAPDSMGFLSGGSLYAGVVQGAGDAPAARQDTTTTWIYAGAAVPTPVEGLTAGLAYDYIANGATGAMAHTSSYASIFGLYLSYQATEKMAIHTRAEYGSASAGTWYLTSPATDNDPNNEVFALTGTLDYALWDNVLSRLELRWDTSLTGGGATDQPFGGSAPGVVAGTAADEKNNISLTANIVYKF
jgi:hypothetical protein